MKNNRGTHVPPTIAIDWSVSDKIKDMFMKIELDTEQ